PGPHPALPPFPTRRSSDLILYPNQPVPKLIIYHALIYEVFIRAGDDIVHPRELASLRLCKVEIGGAFVQLGPGVQNGNLLKRIIDRKSTRLNSSHRTISYA